MLPSHTRVLVSVMLGALLVSGPVFANPEGPKVTFVKGVVETGPKADGAFTKLKRNKSVAPGHFVKTGENSRAELKFSDGSVLRIGPSSLLHVKEASFDKKTKAVTVDATVIGGKAWANVSKLVGSESKFEVTSHNAVAGVRGTVFRVNVDRDDATVVKVYDGAVAVSNSPFFSDKPASASVTPIDPNRQQIAAPFQEVSKKEWEQIVKRMMEVHIGPDGNMSQANTFTADQDKVEDPDWVNWNLACDKGDCDAY